MTRTEIEQQIALTKSKYLLLQLPTSYGKSKIALDILKQRIPKTNPDLKILIIIPRLVLIDTWKKEIEKWKCKKYLKYITFTTYVSLHKHHNQNWDIAIFDECHHLSQRCLDCLGYYNNAILLSATVNKQKHDDIQKHFTGITEIRVSIKNAVNEGILPDPKVILYPITLNNTNPDCVIVKNPKKGNPITIPYKQRWQYGNVKGCKIYIQCTEQQFYDDITSYIEWCRKRIDSPIFKQLFLRKSGDRLKWLSDRKTEIVKQLLKFLQKERTLTFCNSIAQTELLGEYCVNSKNSNAQKILDNFNSGKLNHITACNMLDEGVNLTNCRIGIYASLNSSDRMIVQKLGRLLRHPNPIIIIPYFVNTRDEELVQKMCLNYNPELINKVNTIEEIINLL